MNYAGNNHNNQRNMFGVSWRMVELWIGSVGPESETSRTMKHVETWEGVTCYIMEKVW